MAYSGTGAGTVGDPFQITTVPQFKELDGSNISVPVFSGVGLNDATSSGVCTATDLVSIDYTFTINAIGVINTHSAYSGGTGYVVGNLFTINGGTTLATGQVTSITGNGIIFAYTILTFGSGYSIANQIDTTATSGVGTGFKINILSLRNSFNWKKGAGAETSVIITGATQTIVSGIQIRFNAITGHTLNDVWVITVTPGSYYKLMNNIDY